MIFVIFILSYFLFIPIVENGRVTLKNTLGKIDLSNWPASYPDSLCDNSWRLANGRFATCSPVDTNLKQNCTQETLPYDVKEVNIAFVDIKTESRSCASQKVNINGCQENFKIYHSLKNTLNERDKLIFSLDIPGQVTYGQDGFANKMITFSTIVKNYKYITYFMNSQYYCGNVESFRVYYFQCQSTSKQLVDFPEVSAPATGEETIYGQCTQHSLPTSSRRPYQKCGPDGQSEVFGSCQCVPGYEKQENACKACKVGTFKSKQGNNACENCGSNSDSRKTSQTSCECLEGFYRALPDVGKFEKSCHKIPDEISGDIIIEQLTSTSANVTWTSDYSDPSFTGFRFTCASCPDAFRDIITNSQFVYVFGLGSFTSYNVSVAITNDQTNLTQQFNEKTKSFTTKLGTLPTVTNVEKVFNEDGSVALSWKMPKGIANPNEVVFVVEYDGKRTETKDTSYIIEPGSEDQNLIVKIYLKVTKGGTTYMSKAEEIEVSIAGGGIALGLVIGIIVGVVVALVFAFAIVFCIWKRRHPAYLQVVRMEDGTVKLPRSFLPGGHKLYVDPTTYNAVDDAVEQFNNEIPRSDLHIGQLLGGGEFAEVFKGSLEKNGKHIDVAIKTLRHGAPKKDRDDFLSEAAILGQFNDPNVISIEGVITRGGPNMIILEFMENGALDKYLQNNDTKFTVLQLLGMARGVACGMKYLSELGYIHRDLAGRNVLVNDKQICKVSDFGMTREIKVDDTYDTQGGKVPVRWTAPESIQFKKFTSASDIWSYGILLWEIMSFGERPYWDWQNIEVLERVNSGYRLPPPMSCPKVLHDLMLQCWNKDRMKRPKFHEIRDILEKWIRNPDSLQEIASVVTKTDENLDYTVLQTMYKWLLAIGMDRYTNNFLDQGFATPRQILDLTESDLEALGIVPIGHRRKIYKAIKNTKMQVESRDSRHSSVSSRRKLTSFSKR